MQQLGRPRGAPVNAEPGAAANPRDWATSEWTEIKA
jgi:hypothetical protein